MPIISAPPEVLTIIAAELMALLTRSSDITVIFKNSRQRLASEQERVRRGLRKELILDFALYVPASAALLLLVVEPMLPRDWMARAYSHAILGSVAYAFPFAAFKKAALFTVLRSLAGFMSVLSESERAELLAQSHKSEGSKRLVEGSSNDT